MVASRFEALQAKGLSPSDALLQASEALRTARYDKTNYLFVYDTSGTVLVHGNRPEYEGSNRMHRVDSSGVKLVENSRML